MRPNMRRPIENCYVVPGTRLIAGEYPGSPPGNPAGNLEEKLAQFLDAGVTVFLDLTDPADGLAPYESALRALAARRGVEVAYERLTIRDMDVCDAQHMYRILNAIDAYLSVGRTVYVHCWGGVGRTGTVVGCWLVRHGKRGRDALDEVARLFATMSEAKRGWHPEGSPQTKVQRRMVERWSESVLSVRAERAKLARSLHMRLRGCLLGGALGDALGATVEFMLLKEIRRQYGARGITGFEDAAANRGEITDDTQMTLFTAEGILRSTTRCMEYGQDHEPKGTDWNGEHLPHAAVMWHAYRRWLHTQREKRPGSSLTDGLDSPGDPGWLIQIKELHARRAPGNTCLSALGGPQCGGGSVEQPLNNSKGCGGVMRVAPIGVVPCDDPFQYAVMAAALTHGHPSGYLSAGAFAQIISDLFFDQLSLPNAVARALARLSKENGHEETTRALMQARDLADQRGEVTPERVEQLGSGWTGEEALAIGIYCALVSDSFEHGVCLAVNHSGDSDSTGSIAGALLGVQVGEYGLPAEWLKRLHLREVIAAVADDLLVGYGGGPAWRNRYPGS